MEQYTKSDNIKALYILILQSLLRKFDIGANKRQSIFYTIAGTISRQLSYPAFILLHHQSRNPPHRYVLGLFYPFSHLVMGEIGTWWLHIKLTHSRMSLGYHEWPGVLFISVWRTSGCCPPGRELCCLDVETGKRACTTKPILVLWMQLSFLSFKLKKGPHIQDRDSRCANCSRVLKIVIFYCDSHAFALKCNYICKIATH